MYISAYIYIYIYAYTHTHTHPLSLSLSLSHTFIRLGLCNQVSAEAMSSEEPVEEEQVQCFFSSSVPDHPCVTGAQAQKKKFSNVLNIY
jgi:hypothetical protein